MKLTPALADAWQLRLSAAIEAQDKGRAEILNNHHRRLGQNAADTPEARCAVTTGSHRARLQVFDRREAPHCYREAHRHGT